MSFISEIINSEQLLAIKLIKTLRNAHIAQFLIHSSFLKFIN